jgi:septum formation topological specificity factor MinE
MKHKLKDNLPGWIPLVGKKAKKLGLEADVLGNMRSSFIQVIDEYLEMDIEELKQVFDL